MPAARVTFSHVARHKIGMRARITLAGNVQDGSTFEPDAGFLDHLAPLCHLGFQERSELGRRTADGDSTGCREGLGDFRLAHDCGNFSRDLVDNGARHAGWCHHRLKCLGLVTLECLAYGRHIGHRVQPLRRANRERLHLAAFDVRRRRNGGGEQHRHAAADHIRNGGRNAFVRNMGHVDAGHALEELRRQVRRRSRAGCCERELARPGFGHHYHFWRPVTAIRNGDLDGNDATDRDAAWIPFIGNPLHPEYPSAHSILASAVAAVLQAEIGDGPAPELATTSPTAKGVTRRWTSVGAFAKEVADARVYEGIHYRTSTEVGAAMGRQIGELAAVKFLGQSAIAADAPARTAAVQ
ncbi:MAG: phosphatase PAP2 family protein [Betaproteobacteria bacterium]|nr:phosphatase PAP2 family protein [Betaproteobacteria bacterium]